MYVLDRAVWTVVYDPEWVNWVQGWRRETGTGPVLLLKDELLLLQVDRGRVRSVACQMDQCERTRKKAVRLERVVSQDRVPIQDTRVDSSVGSQRQFVLSRERSYFTLSSFFGLRFFLHFLSFLFLLSSTTIPSSHPFTIQPLLSSTLIPFLFFN